MIISQTSEMTYGKLAPVKKLVLIILVLILILSGASVGKVFAQEEPVDRLVYIVEEGDNLWSISIRFGVSLDKLKSINGITDEGQISIGSQLLIPGFENLGLTGVLNTLEVGFGDDIHSISKQANVPIEGLARLNRFVSPGEIYLGMPIVVVESPAEAQRGSRPMLVPGQSLMELSILRQSNPWNLVNANPRTEPGLFIPGEVLWLPESSAGSSSSSVPGAFPDSISSAIIDPVPAVQGETTQIVIEAESSMVFQGEFTGHPLNFFELGEGSYLALQGVHAMLEPGFYPISIEADLGGGGHFAYTQNVYVRDGDYVIDPVLKVSPETIDPAVTRPEDAQWGALTLPVTPEKYWQGPFQPPVPAEFAQCYPSKFGSRRSYNGSAYDYFHTGLDFCGNTSTEIYAPAAGIVVFAGPLTVRGNATVIDHGMGIYTGYLHQSEIYIKAGEKVEAGQLIGKIGATGRVTGPHLHFEIWVGGVQVDPLTWLQESYPRLNESDS